LYDGFWYDGFGTFELCSHFHERKMNIYIVTIFSLYLTVVSWPLELPGIYKSTTMTLTIHPVYLRGTDYYVSDTNWTWRTLEHSWSLNWNGTTVITGVDCPYGPGLEVTFEAQAPSTIPLAIVFRGEMFINQAVYPTSGLMLSGPLVLVEEGPMGGRPWPNIGQQGRPFASERSTAPFLNDGRYGSGHTWLGNADPPAFVGLAFLSTIEVTSVAFGRDNHGLRTDRAVGRFTLQYTLETNPGSETDVTEIAETGWKTLGWINYSESGTGLFSFPSLRHRYNKSYSFCTLL